MTTDIETAVSVRWRFEQIAYATSDLVRVRTVDGTTLLLLANGYESGFSTCWPIGSRLLLDELERAWASGGGSAAARLGDAVEAASAAFCEKAPSIVPADGDFGEEFVAGTFLAVAVTGATAEVVWVGDAGAVLVRRGAVAARTRPHTMGERIREEFGKGPPPAYPFRGVVTRLIGPSRDDGGPETASFEMRAGDTLVLATPSDVSTPVVPAETLASIVEAQSNVQAASAAVASAVYSNGEPPFAVAVTLRAR